VQTVPDELRIDPAPLASELEAFISRQMEAFRRNGVILGLSGGIDSAVVAALAARAVGRDQVVGLFMPERDSDPQSRRDALAVAEKLGIVWREFGLTPMLTLAGIYGAIPLRVLGGRKLQAWAVRRYYERYARAFGESPLLRMLQGTRGRQTAWLDKATAYHRIKHRMRMMMWYYHAELENRLVLGCCNRTEEMTGLFVKYGDSAADVAPISRLYKTQVRQMAEYLDLPRQIITKAPSPDLMPGITDEYVLGISFDVLDSILVRLEGGQEREAVASDLGLPVDRVAYVTELMNRSMHMREMPPSP
jgi:NAD+ synthase